MHSANPSSSSRQWCRSRWPSAVAEHRPATSGSPRLRRRPMATTTPPAAPPATLAPRPAQPIRQPDSCSTANRRRSSPVGTSSKAHTPACRHSWRTVFQDVLHGASRLVGKRKAGREDCRRRRPRRAIPARLAVRPWVPGPVYQPHPHRAESRNRGRRDPRRHRSSARARRREDLGNSPTGSRT